METPFLLGSQLSSPDAPRAVSGASRTRPDPTPSPEPPAPLTLAGVSRISAAGAGAGAGAGADADAEALSALSPLMPATAGWKLIFTMAAPARASALQPPPVQPQSVQPPLGALQAPEVWIPFASVSITPPPALPAPARGPRRASRLRPPPAPGSRGPVEIWDSLRTTLPRALARIH